MNLASIYSCAFVELRRYLNSPADPRPICLPAYVAITGLVEIAIKRTCTSILLRILFVARLCVLV